MEEFIRGVLETEEEMVDEDGYRIDTRLDSIQCLMEYLKQVVRLVIIIFYWLVDDIREEKEDEYRRKHKKKRKEEEMVEEVEEEEEDGKEDELVFEDQKESYEEKILRMGDTCHKIKRSNSLQNMIDNNGNNNPIEEEEEES